MVTTFGVLTDYAGGLGSRRILVQKPFLPDRLANTCHQVYAADLSCVEARIEGGSILFGHAVPSDECMWRHLEEHSVSSKHRESVGMLVERA